MEDWIFQADRLDIGYGTHVLVKGMDLKIRQGEILTLIGPNGAGKSTFLKTITKQIRPLGGTVYLDGRSAGSLDAKQISKIQSILMTRHTEPELMTCKDVVSTGRYPYTGRFGVLGREDLKKVDEAMELVGVRELEEKLFSDISDGQRQRVMLARAICQEPRILVMDEPASFLDIKYKLELLRILRQLTRERKTAVIMTLHELELARQISDLVACIKNGRIDRFGPPGLIFSGGYIRRLFDAEAEGFQEVYAALERDPAPSDEALSADPYTHYIRNGKKLLRCGITTGTCAALAAEGAARLLLDRPVPNEMIYTTPKGFVIKAGLEDVKMLQDGRAQCAVRKDAGDDQDVTDGVLVYAAVEKTDRGIVIDGGEGIGRVTKPGLDQPPGQAAINSVPRAMIRERLLEVCGDAGYTGGLKAVISIPGGEALARRTLNQHVGVEGGLSILGTSGIVEPMSEQALTDTIRIEMNQALEGGEGRAVLVFGNYGEDFLKNTKWDITGIPVVKCSNFIGEALDIASGLPFTELLLVGHAGKLVKLAGGIMNTHSRYADCRREIFTAYAAVNGAGTRLCRELMSSVSSDYCIELLEGAGLKESVCRSIIGAVQENLQSRLGERARIGAVMFSSRFGLLGFSEEAERILDGWHHDAD